MGFLFVFSGERYGTERSVERIEICRDNGRTQPDLRSQEK